MLRMRILIHGVGKGGEYMWKWLDKIKPKKVQNSVALDSDEFLKMLGIDIEV